MIKQALLVGASVLVALGMFVSFRAFKQIEEASQARQNTRNIIERADNLLSELRDAETGQRGYLITGNEAFLEPYLAVRDIVSGHLAELRGLTHRPAAQARLDTLAPLMQGKMEEMARVIELRRQQDIASATAVVENGHGKHLMDAIRAEMSGFIQIENGVLAQREAQYQSNMRRLLVILTAASLLILLLWLLFAYLLHRETQHQIKNRVYLETQHLLQIQQETNKQLQRANATLQLSEEKLAVTLHSIGDAVIATDAEGRITFLNPVAEKLTGWAQAAASGRPIDNVFRIINQETRQPCAIPVKTTLEHGTVQGLANHTVLIALDGGECAIADSCAPIRDREGLVIGAVLVFRDVTKEYAAQQAGRNSEEKYRHLFDSSRDALMVMMLPAWRFSDVNQEAMRLFGADGKIEFTALGAADISPERQPDGRLTSEKWGEMIERAMNENSHFFEWEYRRLRGEPFAADVLLTRMESKGAVWLQATVRDISQRKVTAQALSKAEALQRAIFNSANFSSIATDAKGVIQIFNVGAERMLGYAAAEVMNKITPADISDPQELIERAKSLSSELAATITPGFEALVFKASRGIEDIYELTYIRKDGSRFPAVVSVTALRDERDGIIGYLLIGTDNSARKRAEEALLKAGALQSAIFNSANFSSIATDAKGVIQIFNVGAERMLGYAAAEVMNKITPADISDPQELIMRAKSLSSELATTITPGFEALVFKASRGIEDIYELTYIRKDGSRFPAVVSVTALRDAQGAIIGYLLIGTDNTARKQIEAEQKILAQRLRDHQFYTRSLFESNIDALMTTDLAGIITDVNKQMESLTGCTRDELIGAPFKNYFTDPARAEMSINLALSDKKVTNYELTVLARDGQETTVSYNATTFYDRDRKLQGVFAAARDVTERNRLTQALEEQNVELESAKFTAEKANLAKSDFLSSMSHELRSPLNAILGFAQLLESATPPPTASQSESVAQILQAGWHLLKLINEVLDLAVVESGKVSLSSEPVSLADVALECQAMMEPLAKQRGIVMSFPPPAPACFVYADRTRLKQVLINLLSNAIKYNREKGTVDLKWAACGVDRIHISVEDSGPGLPPEKLAQLFQSFNRLGQEASGEEGTGIGLVVSKRLVELMGGAIGAKSSVGVGSVFWIELLQAPAPDLKITSDDPKPVAHPQLLPGARRRTLLHVEDNPANLKLVEQLTARRPDIQLFSAINGTLGIELARTCKPEVILMDINMPGISGIDALKILRQDPATSHIPIVALSANALPRDVERGLKAGFFRYLTKPIKVKEFMDTLDEALKLAAENTAAIK